MSKNLSLESIKQYHDNGYYFPIRVLSREKVLSYRAQLESYETRTGEPIHSNLRHKVHLLFRWTNELVRNPSVLDAVEDVIGPNILCWTSTFFIKEANNPSFVSWHQDSTYWGLDPPDIVTAWVAISDAPIESGAMKFLPGSHKSEQLEHRDTFDKENLLSRGQEIAVSVDESKGVPVPLEAGEASLHHVKLVHGSEPNTTNDRRIGIAIRYIPTYVKQLKVRDSATLVRGVDEYNNFDMEPDPVNDLDDNALKAHKDAVDRQFGALYEGTDAKEFRK